jgi:hypothetical protein
MAVRPLPLQACLGFGGTVGHGLILHPDNKTLIYPLGTTIVLRDKVCRKKHSHILLMDHLHHNNPNVLQHQQQPMGSTDRHF